MFAIQGYTSLAELWCIFEARFGAWCREKAILYYKYPDISELGDNFGSPRDLCEDLFLKSLSDQTISLIAADADPIQIPAKLPTSGASLFVKTTPFEAFQIALRPEEAAPDGAWLDQMGSRHFEASGHTEEEVGEWLGGGVDDERWLVFNTLPHLFERNSFQTPTELPPWTADMLDGDYLRAVGGHLGGRAICLTEASAKTWKNSLSEVRVRRLLLEHLPCLADVEEEPTDAAVGRPAKIPQVINALDALSLSKTNLSWKEKQIRVEEHLGVSVSMSTLRRASKELSEKCQ